MNFTIFLNSRGRVNQLHECIKAVHKTTHDHNNLEVIVRADNDDEETKEFIQTKFLGYKFGRSVPLIGSRPHSLCGSFNEMASMAKGRYLFVLTDDAEITTKGWDLLALAKINQYKKKFNIKDDIIYGAPADTSIDKVVGAKYASFPIISKQAVNLLGFFMYESFVGLGGDSCIHRVYEQAGRVVDLSEIQIDHVYNNTIFKVMSPDLTGHEMRQRTAARPVDPFAYDVSKDVEKLKNFIKSYGS
jgi:glycosyltransferase involved in cell wall biosynthesis